MRLWEVATGAERGRFPGHRSAARCGVFSPNGRRFFSGSEDTTVLIWDVTGRVAVGRPERIKLTPRELEELRTDLAAADASRAYRALWTLVAAPSQAVALFRDQLRPVIAADPQRVAKLLADLDSNALDMAYSPGAAYRFRTIVALFLMEPTASATGPCRQRDAVGDAVEPAGQRLALADRAGLPNQHEKRGLKGVFDLVFLAQQTAADVEHE